ncbi:MAG: HPr(Ser) kinase/phosphatase [Gemmatimonadota bacterium]|nr:HPr(Ser) kinase/phosphatase [Gemmatimonadota bacterium]
MEESEGAESKRISVREVLDVKRDTLGLEVMNDGVPLDGTTDDADITSPGLALAGHMARVPSGRLWVFGETEMTYMATLDRTEARERLEAFFSFGMPAVFVTKGQDIPTYFLECASAREIPVLRSSATTREFYHRIKPFLEMVLAPTTALHGSMADVYGVGLLFIGESGIGKSECVLDLVERGHRLVADDLILVRRTGNDVLMGRGHELQRHHMEIRGVGIIDVSALFGVTAIRQQKRIEVVVQLETWDQDGRYTRTGLDVETHEILGVEIPKVTVPLNPGKNITVISEVVAMNHLLTYSGIHSADSFDKRLRQYLEQDYE